MIKKKVISIGNSWGIIIPKAILDGLSINPVTDEVTLKIDNNAIKIEKIENKKDLWLEVFFIGYAKYLFNKPSKPLPWRASSFAISWTVSWIAS